MIRGFGDFNLSPQTLSVPAIRPLCEAALNAGYKTVAINTQVEETVFESRKLKKKQKGGGEARAEGDLIPAPMNLDELKKEFDGQLLIYQRLTVPISDNLQVHKLTQSKNAGCYDIFAVLPLTPVAYQAACSTMEVDLVTNDPQNYSAFRISRKLVRQAVERGVHFELQYSPCVLDSGCRRNIITYAHTLHAVGRGAVTMVVSSAASHQDHFRSPYDVANLGFLFGLSEEKAKSAISHNCRSLLLRAQARRHGKAVVCAYPITQSCDEEKMELDDESTAPAAKKKKGAEETT